MRFLAALPLCLIATLAQAETGIASVYGNGDGYEWGPTANCYRNAKGATQCERMNPRAMTAAHRTLPIGAVVAVTNRNNGNSILVRINDRGPFVRGRIIDLSPAAARVLGFDDGLRPVTVERVP